MEKKTCVFLACNENYAFALANVIIGLRRYNEDLITNIVVYHDITEETRGKISRLWEDKIIFIEYTHEDFLRDLGGDIGKVPLTSRFGERFVHAKFHIFELLEKYDCAVWLDCDTLVVDRIKDFLCLDEIDFKCDCGGRIDGATKYLEAKGLLNTNKPIMKPVGGVLSFSKQCLNKTNSGISGINLTQQCFKILKELYKYECLIYPTTSDEIPFGILTYLYDFKVQNKKGFYNTLPQSSRNSKIIHTMGKTKFWESPFSYVAFSEWAINHKIWKNISGDERQFSLRSLNFGSIDTPDKVYLFLIYYHLFCPLLPLLQDFIANNAQYKLYLKLPIKDRYLDIYSKRFQGDIFYRFALNLDGGGNAELKSKCEIQIVCKEKGKLRYFANEVQRRLDETYTPKDNRSNGEIIVYYFTKNIEIDYSDLILEFKGLVEQTCWIVEDLQ